MKKKLIAALSVLSLACALTACGVSATAKHPEKEEPKTPVYDAPVVLDENTEIDGVKEAMYGENSLSFIEPRTGITVTTWTHLGENGLYLYSEADDKNVYYASDRAFHENDSIEYYLDPDPATTLSNAALNASVKTRGDCLQVRVNALGENQTWFGRRTGGYPWARGYFPLKTAAKVNGEMNVKNGAMGYSTEAFIPWGAFGLSEKPEEIGVMPAFVNVDNREDTSRTWFTVKGMGHADPSGYARADRAGFKDIGLSAAPRKELTADKNDGFYTGDTLLLREVNEKNELSSATERANLKARLGDDGVYFLATVKDKVCTRHNDSIWNNDGIEFLIDGAGTGGSSVFRDGILRVGIDVDGGVETDIAKSGVNDYIPFRRAAFANVGVNTLEEAESVFNYRYEYVYEVMIPYSSLGFTEKPVALAFGWAVKTPNERACILDRMGSDGNMEAQDWLWEDGHFPQNPNEYFEVGEAGIPVKTHYDFPEWTAWENCAVQADAKERYNFRGKAADNGLYLNVEQYVDNYVRGSNWDSSTHIELEIWQHNIGWGFGGTYFAFFGNGSYFINKEDNVKKIVNQVTVADRGAEADFRYVISYEIFIEFDNNLENSQDGPYAFVQIMSFTPNETDEGYEKAVKITKDGNRELWTDNCKSYTFHAAGIDGKDTGDYPHGSDAYSDWEAVTGRIRTSEGALLTDVANTLAIKKNTALSEGTYTAQAVSASDGRLGLVFGYTDENNYNFFFVDRAKWEVGILKVVNGQKSATTNYLSASFEKMTSYPMKVELTGGKYYCTFWNTLYFIGESAGGGIGFASDVAGNKFHSSEVNNSVADRRVDTLILGHSYMELWHNYADDLSGIDEIGSVYNMAISGSHTSHWNPLVDSVAAYEPKTVIIGIGVNDLFWIQNEGVRAASENLAKFLADAKAKLPKTKFLVLAVSHCVNTENQGMHKMVVDLNENFRTICADDENFIYLDVEDSFLMFGKPVASLFTDGLHPTEYAYRLHFVPAIKSALGESLLGNATPPEWGAEGTVRSSSQARYDYRGYAAEDGLYLNMVQYVDSVKLGGDNWANTHVEMQIWNHNFGGGKQWGMQADTFVACFLDGTYYINNQTDVAGIEYRVTAAEETGGAYRYKISYEIFIGFANGFANTDEPYASVKFMSFAPNETTGYGDGAEQMNKDGRMVWTDKCHSYGIHKSGIDARQSGLLEAVPWTAWEDCQFRSEAQNRFDYRAFATDDGLYLNMVQFVDRVKTDGDNWGNTHFELKIFNRDFGFGWGGTFVACFLDGTYYINSETNVKGIVYSFKVTDLGESAPHRYKIEYFLHIGFANNAGNADGPYAFVDVMSFMPEETGDFGTAQQINQDGRMVWKDNCNSYGIHENGIDSKDTGA